MRLNVVRRVNARCIAVACTLLVVTTISTSAVQTPLEAIDLDLALKVIMDEESTTLQKDALLGKRYSGVITVADVERTGTSEKPVIRVIADLSRPNQTSFGKMAVDLSSGVSNVDVATQLRKGTKIRITGRLSRVYVRASGFVNVSGTEWIELLDATIDDVLPK